MGDMQQFDLMSLSFAQMQQVKKQMEDVSSNEEEREPGKKESKNFFSFGETF